MHFSRSLTKYKEIVAPDSKIKYFGLSRSFLSISEIIKDYKGRAMKHSLVDFLELVKQTLLN